MIDDCITSFLQSKLLHSDGAVNRDHTRYASSNKSELADSHYGIPSSNLYGSDQFSPPDLKSFELPGYVRSGRMTSSASDRHDSVRGNSMSATHEPAILGSSVPSSHKENTFTDHQQQFSLNESKIVFKRLEEYVVDSLHSQRDFNASFSSQPLSSNLQAGSEDTVTIHPPSPPNDKQLFSSDSFSTLDEKTLLLGDFAENGAWWTGRRSAASSAKPSRTNKSNGSIDRSAAAAENVTSKSPRIDWSEVDEWYDVVCHPGRGWRDRLEQISASDGSKLKTLAPSELDGLRIVIAEAESHIRRTLLKATESLLKRPGGHLKEPGDIRFLLILLGNPLLYPSSSTSREARAAEQPNASHNVTSHQALPINTLKKQASFRSSANSDRTGPGKHSTILKRIFGLLSNLSNECHHHLVAWFARLSAPRFRRITELLGGFVTYRLTRQHGKRRIEESNPVDALVPSMSSNGHTSSAALHAALDPRTNAKPKDGRPKPVVYNDDWQIKAAARVMALLFAANNSGATRQCDRSGRSTSGETGTNRRGQALATSDFYNTLLDYSDLIADFEAWESKRGKFTFCQYPFFLSIWAKIQIMEHDARRQMEVKAREAFFDSIMTRKAVNQYLILKVRRDCLVEDSLKGVSEVVGSGSEEIKKGLRIEFKGEEGIDAGGLRKEWFLLLVRDVFNPDHGISQTHTLASSC